MYDGHKSHLSITLAEWAKKRNVVLFVLPPHTSHLTQPLDVAVFDPLKSQYYKQRQSYLQQNPGISITRYEVAKLTARPYLKALCPDNITAGFKKSGIYPFNSQTLAPSQLAPASIYPKGNEKPVDTTSSNTEVIPDNAQASTSTETIDQTTTTHEYEAQSSQPPLTVATEIPIRTPQDKMKSFFEDRKITKVVQRPKKRFVPPFSITGNLLEKSNVDAYSTQAKKKKVSPTPNTKSGKERKDSKQQKGKTAKTPVKKAIKKEMQSSTNDEPRPGTSGLHTTGGPINIETPEISSGSDTESISDDEKCCVCKLFHPKQLHGCAQLIFVKWGECSICKHWTHLGYCTDVRVLRRGDIFRCPHCVEE